MKKQKKKKNKFKKHLPEIIYGTCCVAVFSTMAFSIWHFLIKPDAQQVNINAPETPATTIYAEVTTTIPTGHHGHYRSEKDHCRKNSC